MEQQVNNYEVRLEELSQLSDEELYLRFWHLAERLVEPLVDYARTHTTPSIERSVLMRMGFTSLEAQPFVQKSIEQGMIGKGCGAILLEYAQKHSTSIRQAYTALMETGRWDDIV